MFQGSKATAGKWPKDVHWPGTRLLTVLQRGHSLCLCTEVTVPDVIGSFQAQLVGGEGPQPGTRKRPVIAVRPPSALPPGAASEGLPGPPGP